MVKDIGDELLGWLRTTGYPFQLQAGRALQAAGWHVNHSRWYRDPASDKHRELDLQAVTGAVRGGEAHLSFSLSIECKTSTALPWVALSSRPDGAGRSFLASAPGLMTHRFVLAAQALELALPDLFPASTLYADSLVSGFVESDYVTGTNGPKKRKPAKEQSDPTSPHSSLLQAVTAASALDAELFNLAIGNRPEIATATVVLPVVLLRGRLFSYAVDTQLRDALTEVGSALVSVPTDSEAGSTVVAVLTEGAAAPLWEPMCRAAHGFCAAALPHAGRIANALTMSDQQIIEQI